MVRIKHRYLLVNILYPSPPPVSAAIPPPPVPELVQFHRPTADSLTPQVLLRAVREQIGLLYGDWGVGVTGGGLSVKYLSPATSTFILRCPRANYRIVWAALTLLTQLPVSSKGENGVGMGGAKSGRGKGRETGTQCVMRVVRVSGTIRKSEEEAIRIARADILRARREGEGDGLGRSKQLVGALEAILGAGHEADEGGIEDVDMGGEEDEDDGDED